MVGVAGKAVDEAVVIDAWRKEDAFAAEEAGLLLLDELQGPALKCAAHTAAVDQRRGGGGRGDTVRERVSHSLAPQREFEGHAVEGDGVYAGVRVGSFHQLDDEVDVAACGALWI